MITLLRDLTSVTPPAGGFDRLPKSTETTLGADLARIKFYRNRLAHLDDAKIDQVSFITNWNDVTSVCNVVLLSENCISLRYLSYSFCPLNGAFSKTKYLKFCILSYFTFYKHQLFT